MQPLLGKRQLLQNPYACCGRCSDLCFLLFPCSPPGTYAAFEGDNTYLTCKSCADGYYRPGDASANNNACRMIPAGVCSSSVPSC